MKSEKLFTRLIAMVMVVGLLVVNTGINAQVIVKEPSSTGTSSNEAGGSYSDGLMQGKMDASGNALWLLAGFGCSCFGVLAAYLVKPNPPVHAIVGKSSQYVMGYNEGYQKKAKKANAGYAWAGCALGTIVSYAVSYSGTYVY